MDLWYDCLIQFEIFLLIDRIVNFNLNFERYAR